MGDTGAGLVPKRGGGGGSVWNDSVPILYGGLAHHFPVPPCFVCR